MADDVKHGREFGSIEQQALDHVLLAVRLMDLTSPQLDHLAADESNGLGPSWQATANSIMADRLHRKREALAGALFPPA